MLIGFGENVSIYYENMASGFVYTYNEERVYFGASLSKAAYALYLFQRAERGEIDLDAMLTFTSDDRNVGSGVINFTYPVGTQFSVRELIRYNLSESDNVATLILRRTFGTEGYARFIGGLGADPTRVRERVMSSDLSVLDAGIFIRTIFEYIEAGGPYSAEFRDALVDNQWPFITSPYTVASKTGWDPNRPRWHDMAIVYAPSPFVLVIMSSWQGFREVDYRRFGDIADMFHGFNARYFEGR